MGDKRGHPFRPAEPTDRNRPDHCVDLVRGHGGDARTLDRSRRDRVDGDAEWGSSKAAKRAIATMPAFEAA
jgi:hypothetical protein